MDVAKYMTEKYPKKPAVNGYFPIPQAPWQEELTRAILENRDYSDKWLLKYEMKRHYYRDQVIVIYSNWTLHFQIAFLSDEWKEGNYGDLDGKVLLSFDVENGTRGVKPKDLGILQKAISQALLDGGCPQTLGENASFEPHKHHLVWETVDYIPQNADSIQAIANRLFEYMDAIYPIAEPILMELNA
jgi:hypothetical protein